MVCQSLHGENHLENPPSVPVSASLPTSTVSPTAMLAEKVVIPFESLKKNINISQVTMSVGAEYGVSIEVSHSNTQKHSLFAINGLLEEKGKLLSCRRALMSRLMAPVTVTVIVPHAKRGLILGQGGRTLTALAHRARVRVDVPRAGDLSDEVHIIGDPEGVSIAKSEIFSLINTHPHSHSESEQEDFSFVFERSYWPWINQLLESRHDQVTYRLFKNVENDKRNNSLLTLEFKNEKSLLVECQELVEKISKETVVEYMWIPRRLFGKLVGKRGVHVKKIFEKIQCSVNVPSQHTGECYEDVKSNSHHSDDDDDDEIEDNVEDDGAPNVLIRGRQKDIPYCIVLVRNIISDEKDEMTNNIKESNSNTVSEAIVVPSSFTKFIVGKGGKIISALRRETHTRIEILSMTNGLEGVLALQSDPSSPFFNIPFLMASKETRGTKHARLA